MILTRLPKGVSPRQYYLGVLAAVAFLLGVLAVALGEIPVALGSFVTAVALYSLAWLIGPRRPS
jgi:hypothetical protein